MIEVLAPGIGFLPMRSATLPPATHTNCVFLGGPSGDLVVLDPGSDFDDQLSLLGAEVDSLASRGGRIREIWLSHHHHDHVAGAVWLATRCGAPIVAHERTRRLLGAGIPVARLADEALLHAGDRSFQILHTPGHASGHLCLFEPQNGTLLAGDMVAGRGTILVDPPDGDMAAYLHSLERLCALSPRLLLPAHGDPSHDGKDVLASTLAHRRWRENRVLEALAGREARPEELLPQVYSDAPPATHPLAFRALMAHLEKLVSEGKVVRVGGGRLRAVR